MSRKPSSNGTRGAKRTTAVPRCTGPAPAGDEYFVLGLYAIRIIDPVLSAWATAGGTLP